MSFHLSQINTTANFTLVDYMEESIEVAKNTNSNAIERFNFKQGDIYNLDFPDNHFDIVFCWQTLSWLDNPEKALSELIRVVKDNGKIYLSSLFNLNHDVDIYIYSKVYDYTRNGALSGV